MSDQGLSSPAHALAEGELRVLLKIALIINSLEEPQAVLEQLMDLFLTAMDAERGLLLTFGPAGEPKPLVARNLSDEVVSGMTATFSRRAVEEMAGAGQIVVSEDVLHDKRFQGSESVLAQHIQSLLAVPIRVGGSLKGAIYVDHRSRSRTFSDRDLAFAKALAELSSVILERSQSLQALHEENTALRQRAARYQFGDVIGASDAMQRLFERLEKAVKAPAEAAVLITGENGTGKTQVARLLHRESPRKTKPFVAFGAGSAPESLVESELFGHKKGSFTGAVVDQPGLVERAEGGTLFLDDVDALPPGVQPKLLAFLQDREYRPIGGGQKKSDVRVICATNADLEGLVAAGRFRADLFYRLNGIPLRVPPLRERNEDIPLLAHHFLAHYAKAVVKEVRDLTPQALAAMIAYRWPGNVRELMSEVVHAVTMCGGPYIDVADFKAAELRGSVPAAAGGTSTFADIVDLNLEKALDRTIERVVRTAMEKHEGNVSRAAKAVGVSRGKLYDLMERVGLRARAKNDPPDAAAAK